MRTIDVTSFQFSSKALEGNLLGDPAKREIFVYLPPSYETSNQRYPVVYVMPWGNGQSFSNVSGVTATMNKLVRSGEVREMILVFPDGSNRLFASLFRSSPTVGDYETYLTRELVDYVDNNYRTLVSRDSRGIAGCSNGGEISMRMALRYPDIFSVAAPSGGTYNNEPEGNAILQQELDRITTLPQNFGVLASWAKKYPLVSYFIQEAGGTAANPDSPPFFLDMPFRIVGDHAERCRRSLPVSWRETAFTRRNATSSACSLERSADPTCAPGFLQSHRCCACLRGTANQVGNRPRVCGG